MTEQPPAGTPSEGGKPTALEPEKKTLTQAEIDSIVEERLNRDRKTREEALAKDLGMPLKDAKALLKAAKDAEEAKKSELEKLTGERDTHRTEAEKARLEAAKLRALAKAGADPEKIDALLKRVVGNTPEEIEADVKELQTLGLLQTKPPAGATGAGNTGLQQRQEQTLDEQIREVEAQAIKTGNRDDWARVNRLKAKKYSKVTG